MPVRNSGTTLPRADLTGAALAAGQTMTHLTPLILPPMPRTVGKGSFGKIAESEFFNQFEAARNPKSGFKRVTRRLSEHSYKLVRYGLEELYDEDDRQDYQDLYDYERFMTQQLATDLLRQQDIRTIAAVTNTTTFPLSGDTGLSVSVDWSSPSTATPVADIQAGIRGIKNRNGMVATSLVISYETWLDLSINTQVLDGIKYAQVVDGKLDLGQLAARLGLNEIIVDQDSKNSADEGLTATLTAKWPRTRALLFVKAKSMDIREACLGRTFYSETDGGLLVAEQYIEDKIDSSVYRVKQRTDENIIFSSCGFLLDI